MVELVKYMITELVDDKDAVVITLAEDGETINVQVAQSDMGKIIGKEGRIAKAIRTIVKAASARSEVKYSVVILENE
ncbi:MAG: KH domain-containing protein [Clostridiales bacterium]|nr:KH domain-containing protein [Clostridiales bacterium]